ncbi:hypothetical protein EV1_030265 [Malus domestica]
MKPGDSYFICKSTEHTAKLCPEKVQWDKHKGKIYNISDWANHHPSGERPLLSLAGQDVTDVFVAYHPGSAWQHLDQFSSTLPSTASNSIQISSTCHFSR